MTDIITFNGHVKSISTKADRSVKIVIETATELTDPMELAEMFSLSDDVVSFGLKRGHFTKDELLNIPEPQTDYRGEKSEGQRLRAVLYRWWERKGKPNDFNLFYKQNMERVIDQIKDKL